METSDYKVFIILGTRPEAIKLYPLIAEFLNAEVSHKVISTGQQMELLDNTLKSLGIAIDFNLDLMQENQSPTAFLLRALSSLQQLITEDWPDFIVVQGDTLSAYAGALIGYLNRIPVGHVEAGLRSGNILAPWPEEGLRKMIDQISTILWVPTQSEHVPTDSSQRSVVTGNTVIDTLRIFGNLVPHSVESNEGSILVTLHRRESFGQTIENAMQKIIELSDLVDNEIKFIMHPNPNIRDAAKAVGLHDSNVKVIPPLEYLEFIKELQKSALLITDSGGLQEEAGTLGVPMIILRENTERNQILKSGNAVLSDPNGLDVIKQALDFLSMNPRLKAQTNDIYGDGFASERIYQSIREFLRKSGTTN